MGPGIRALAMRVTLTDHIHQYGVQTRHPEVDRVDFASRVLWLPDGRWVPFERVIIADKPLLEAKPLTKLEPDEPGNAAFPLIKRHQRTAHVCICGLPFPTALALSSHRQVCKGASA